MTRATIDEALRLYPPAATLSREAIGEDWLVGTPIAAGTVVTVAPYLLHRHRRLWKDPELVRPRPLSRRAEREKIDRFAYIPFGAGPRVCIGMPFALQEATIVLARLLSRFRFELQPGCVVTPQQRVTLRPRHGLTMRVRRRGRLATTKKVQKAFDTAKALSYIARTDDDAPSSGVLVSVFRDYQRILLSLLRGGERWFGVFLLLRNRKTIDRESLDLERVRRGPCGSLVFVESRPLRGRAV